MINIRQCFNSIVIHLQNMLSIRPTGVILFEAIGVAEEFENGLRQARLGGDVFGKFYNNALEHRETHALIRMVLAKV